MNNGNFKTALKHINKEEKVELSSEKVELDITQDLDKLSDSLKDQLYDLRVQADNYLSDAVKALEKSKSIEVEMEKAWNKAINRVKSIDSELGSIYEKKNSGIPNQVYAAAKLNEKVANNLKSIKIPR